MNKQSFNNLIKKREKVINEMSDELRKILRGTLVRLTQKHKKGGKLVKKRRYYISYSKDGITKMVYVPIKKLKLARQGLRSYKRFKRRLREIEKINYKIFKEKEEV